MKTNTEHKRAKVGGELGANGDFYRGGRFMLSSAILAEKVGIKQAAYMLGFSLTDK